MPNSTRSTRGEKPAKPYAGFPMFAHPSGQWAKKIRGKLHYFGVWSDPESALERLNRQYPYLKDGRLPPPLDAGEGCILHALANAFMKAKEEKMDAGDLAPRSFRDYHRTCEGLLRFFGKTRRVDDLRPKDFARYRAALAKRLGPTSLKNEVNRCRVVFKFAYDSQLIPQPVAYGQGFDRPSAKLLRRQRNEQGPKLFTAEEVWQLVTVHGIRN